MSGHARARCRQEIPAVAGFCALRHPVAAHRRPTGSSFATDAADAADATDAALACHALSAHAAGATNAAFSTLSAHARSARLPAAAAFSCLPAACHAATACLCAPNASLSAGPPRLPAPGLAGLRGASAAARPAALVGRLVAPTSGAQRAARQNSQLPDGPDSLRSHPIFFYPRGALSSTGEGPLLYLLSRCYSVPHVTKRDPPSVGLADSVLGIELGAALRGGKQEEAKAIALHVAGYLSLGVVHAALRLDEPLASLGDGTRQPRETSLVMGFKAPLFDNEAPKPPGGTPGRPLLIEQESKAAGLRRGGGWG